jgi:hypothetical protein
VPELEIDLPPTAIGKDYLRGAVVASAPSGSGYQLSLRGLLGIAASSVEGLELNLLGLNFGLGPNGLKLPLIGTLDPARSFAPRRPPPLVPVQRRSSSSAEDKTRRPASRGRSSATRVDTVSTTGSTVIDSTPGDPASRAPRFRVDARLGATTWSTWRAASRRQRTDARGRDRDGRQRPANTFVPGRNLLFLTFAAALGYRRSVSAGRRHVRDRFLRLPGRRAPP